MLASTPVPTKSQRQPRPPWKNKPVAPKPKPSKRDAILNAMLDVVVERGFHEAPMSLISERSGASAGVIYHYFASKDEIIHALYERVRNLKTASILEGYSADLTPREAFLQSWTNTYTFYRKHQREMRFLAQYENAGFPCIPDPSAHDQLLDFQARFTSKSQGGVLEDWPEQVLVEMTLGLVGRLASQPQKLPAPTLQAIGEKLWEAVRAKP